MKEKCRECGKVFKLNEPTYFIDDSMEIFCYEDIDSKEDVLNSCIGKNLLKSGYKLDFIYRLFQKDLEDRKPYIFYTESSNEED
ncbi:MAG: hypothetical protein E6182_18880 [Clostridioides difficile]|nr:hypothetical protein [Clostridioides difficile]